MSGHARYISEANHAFSLKGSADDLLEAAKLAVKVKDKIILKEILVEMLGRKQNRETKKKKPNHKLNSYIPAVEEYFKNLDDE